MLLVEDTGAGFRRLEIFGKNKLWMKGDNLKSGFHKIIHFIEENVSSILEKSRINE